MIARERFLEAAHGRPVDRPSVVYWPGPPDGRSDVVVLPPDPEYVKHHDRHDNRAILVEIPNPFGKAWSRNIDLNDMLTNDPQEGERLLTQFAESDRTAIGKVLEAGAEGILYRLHGANAHRCTPMQYGGHYLEYDRELLRAAAGAEANVLFVVGDDSLYLDFVSDLPAALFGWDDRTSGVSAAEGRRIRGGGRVICFDESSDVQLHVNAPSVAQMLEKDHL